MSDEKNTREVENENEESKGSSFGKFAKSVAFYTGILCVGAAIGAAGVWYLKNGGEVPQLPGE